MSSSDILASVAIVAAILSAVYSYRLSRKAHKLSVYHGVINLFRELDKTFVEYPDTRPYFYEGKPVDADDPSRQRVLAAAELVLDTFEWIWHRQEELKAEGEEGWRAYIMDTFYSSPALQQHYASFASWYPGITRLIADRAMATKGRVVGSSGAVIAEPPGRVWFRRYPRWDFRGGVRRLTDQFVPFDGMTGANRYVCGRGFGGHSGRGCPCGCGVRGAEDGDRAG